MSTLARLAKLLRMRFFSVNEYVCGVVTSVAIHFSDSRKSSRACRAPRCRRACNGSRSISKGADSAPIVHRLVGSIALPGVVAGLYQPLADNGALALSHAGAARPSLSSAVASEDKEERTVPSPLVFAFAKIVLRATTQRSIALLPAPPSPVAARSRPRAVPAGFVPQAPAGTALGRLRRWCHLRGSRRTSHYRRIAGPRSAQGGGRLGYEARRLVPTVTLHC